MDMSSTGNSALMLIGVVDLVRQEKTGLWLREHSMLKAGLIDLQGRWFGGFSEGLVRREMSG